MNDFDITDIETRLKEIVRDELKISTTVFNNRPKSADISGDDFCVVKVNGVVKDRGAYGECDVYLSLFAKNISIPWIPGETSSSTRRTARSCR